jgi:hypothetical protein
MGYRLIFSARKKNAKTFRTPAKGFSVSANFGDSKAVPSKNRGSFVSSLL